MINDTAAIQKTDISQQHHQDFSQQKQANTDTALAYIKIPTGPEPGPRLNSLSRLPQATTKLNEPSTHYPRLVVTTSHSTQPSPNTERHDTWINVTRKNNRKNRPRQLESKLAPTTTLRIGRDTAIEMIKQAVSDFSTVPLSGILFGSVARNEHKPTSDIDVVFVWKRKLPENTESLRDKIKSLSGKQVDLINMVSAGKLIRKNQISERDETFLYTIFGDAEEIIGNEGKDIVFRSFMVGKLPK